MSGNKKIDNSDQGHTSKSSGWFVIIMASAGIGICLYLYAIHVALLMGEVKGSLLCGQDSGFGCQTVASSAYGTIMGLPLSALGAVFYNTLVLLGIGGVIFWRDCGRAFLRWALFLAVLGLTVDLYLAYSMIFRIGAVCWLCLATYAINLFIIIILAKHAWKEPKPRMAMRTIFPRTRDAKGTDCSAKRPVDVQYYQNVIKGLLLSGILFSSVFGVAGTQYISKSITKNDRKVLAKIIENLSRQHHLFIETKNRPVMGPDNAKLTVVEFSDFLCPYCAKAAKYLKLAESGTRSTARFVFRHFPLDKSCNRRVLSNIHPGSCLLAEGAVCANEQNKFWDYHDKAFETKSTISRLEVMNIASNIGLDLDTFNQCMDSGRALKVVVEDIEAAYKAGVRGTPTLFINGKRLVGVPKPWMLNEIFRYSEKNY